MSDDARLVQQQRAVAMTEWLVISSLQLIFRAVLNVPDCNWYTLHYMRSSYL